jgi:Mrp family chromosome partitioning ATPase
MLLGRLSRRTAKSSSATRTYLKPNKKKCLPADQQVCFIASMIISLVNSKGGVGKSTLAGNLAGWLARHGRSVILADCDTQQSSSEWITEALPDLQVVRLADADAVLDELPSLAQEFDFRHRRRTRQPDGNQPSPVDVG